MSYRQFLRYPLAHHSRNFVFLLRTILSVCVIFFSSPVFLAAQTSGDPVAQCTPTFSDCAIPENVALQFSFLAISGDVVVAPTLNSNLNSVSDVFRIANNLIDTGEGTGIGFSAFVQRHTRIARYLNL